MSSTDPLVIVIGHIDVREIENVCTCAGQCRRHRCSGSAHRSLPATHRKYQKQYLEKVQLLFLKCFCLPSGSLIHCGGALSLLEKAQLPLETLQWWVSLAPPSMYRTFSFFSTFWYFFGLLLIQNLPLLHWLWQTTFSFWRRLNSHWRLESISQWFAPPSNSPSISPFNILLQYSFLIFPCNIPTGKYISMICTPFNIWQRQRREEYSKYEKNCAIPKTPLQSFKQEENWIKLWTFHLWI